MKTSDKNLDPETRKSGIVAANKSVTAHVWKTEQLSFNFDVSPSIEFCAPLTYTFSRETKGPCAGTQNVMLSEHNASTPISFCPQEALGEQKFDVLNFSLAHQRKLVAERLSAIQRVLKHARSLYW